MPSKRRPKALESLKDLVKNLVRKKYLSSKMKMLKIGSMTLMMKIFTQSFFVKHLRVLIRMQHNKMNVIQMRKSQKLAEEISENHCHRSPWQLREIEMMGL